jgi:hypothetical protein
MARRMLFGLIPHDPSILSTAATLFVCVNCDRPPGSVWGEAHVKPTETLGAE